MSVYGLVVAVVIYYVHAKNASLLIYSLNRAISLNVDQGIISRIVGYP